MGCRNSEGELIFDIYNLHEQIYKYGGDLGRDRSIFAVSRIMELEKQLKEINTPMTEDFMESVKNEADHQRLRWGEEHDKNKKSEDWFWLIGYLCGKSLHNVRGKRQHHIIATAAALYNWYLQEKENDGK